MNQESGMRVCYFGTYREHYTRNRIMIQGLRRNDVDVIPCHVQLWHGIEDRVDVVSGAWRSPAFWWRLVKVYWQLLKQYRQVGDYDVLVVGYPGQLDVFLARVLSWLRGKPLVWDVFMSIYLVALERELDQRSALAVALLRRLEWLACRMPDRLVLDTAAYRAWFGDTHHIDATRFVLVPTGADDAQVYPVKAEQAADAFRVVYYGTYIPNHGVLHMIEAAYLLQETPGIHFEFIGRGPTREQAEALAQAYGLDNVAFTDWVPSEDLPAHLASAQVCLGAFGTTPQSLMTIQNKIYEGMAMRKTVVSGDAATVRETLTHGEHIYLCSREDPAALAQALLTLYRDSALCQHIAEAGHAFFQQHFTLRANGARFRQHLEFLLGEV